MQFGEYCGTRPEKEEDSCLPQLLTLNLILSKTGHFSVFFNKRKTLWDK